MKQWFILGLLLCFTHLGWSQTKLVAKSSKQQVAAGERFNVSFTLNGNASTFTPPALNGFRVHSGPNRSNEMTYVNGRMSSSITFSYVISAKKDGEFTIGEARMKASDKTYRSKPIKIKVTKSATGTATKPNDNDGIASDIFLKLKLSKNKVYQGEQIVATHILYYRVNIVDYEAGPMPVYNGFWSQDIEIPQKEQAGVEMINGTRYQYAVIKKVVLFPQRSGELDIKPIYYDMTVRVPQKAQRRSLFDNFFGQFKDVDYRIESNNAKVTVKPLPEAGKPEGYAGAVGSFSLSASMDKQEVKANDAVNLTITLKGNGNIKLAEPPVVNLPPDFETYDPKQSNKISVSASGARGIRTFEHLMIPRHAGEYTIEPVNFSYFDPAKKRYVELNTDEFILNVAKGDHEVVTATTPGMQKDVTILGEDIRFIKSGAAGLSESGYQFFRSLLYWSLLTLPGIGLLGFVLARGKYQSYASDTVGLRMRKARKIATQRLAAAKKHLDAGEQNPFYEAVFKALYGFLGDKLNLPVADLSKSNIVEILSQRSVDGSTIESLIQTLDRCEMARFAPSSEVSPAQVYEHAATLISQLQEELK